MSITDLNEADAGESPYKQVNLQLWHPGCWTLRVTNEHSNTHIIEKSLYPAEDIIKGDFILVVEDDVSMDEFVESIDGYEVVDNVAILQQSSRRARVVVNYRRDSSIVPHIVDSDFMPIEPVHITEGQEYWTVLVRSAELSNIVDHMEDEFDVELNAIHAIDPTDSLEFADVIDRIHDDLSARQHECVFEAKSQGYYNWPRDLSATDIAETVGVASPTFLEHVRKGEHKILQAVLEELQRRHAHH